MADNKPLTTLERLERLESAQVLTQRHVDDLATSIRETIGGMMLTLQGIIIAMGDGFDAKVQAVIDQKQKERVDAKAAKGKAQVDALVAQGVLVPSDTIKEISLVVGKTLDKDGTVLMPRFQKEFSMLVPDAQAALLGKKVGDSWVSDDSIFEILEIYDINAEQAVEAVAKDS